MKASNWLTAVGLCMCLAACGGKSSDPEDVGSASEKDDGDDEADEETDEEADDSVSAEDEAEDEAAQADDGEDDTSADDESTEDDAASDDGASDDATDTPSGPIPVPPMTTPVAPPIGPTPVAPPAEGCQDASRTVSTNYCSTTLLCSTGYQYSSCSDAGDGSWYCDCSDGRRAGSYSLTGVTGDTACGLALDLCNENQELPEFTGPAECGNTTRTATASYCELYQQCTRSAELEEGISAVERESQYAFCQDLGNGRLSCSCNNNKISRSYELEGIDATTGCDTSLALCSEDSEIEFSDEPTCEAVSQSEATNGCSLQRQCKRTAEVGDGVTALLNDYEYSNCSQGATGDWTCSCGVPTRSLYFRLEPEATGLATCESALTACKSTDEIVPEGEITCGRNYQSASTSYCDATLECAQSAVVDGQEIGLIGSVSNTCQEISAGVWMCYCYSSTQSVEFEMEGTDGWDVCSAAADSCPERVEVQIGAVNGGIVSPAVPMPVPLPVR